MATNCAPAVCEPERTQGIIAPAEMPKKIIVMGKPFDVTKPDAYVSSFAIRKA